MKRALWLCVFLLILLSCDKKASIDYSKMKRVNSSANYGTFKTLKEMEERAVLVVVVTPLEELAKRENVVKWWEDGGLGDVYSRNKMKVIKVFKGDVESGQVISVVEPIAIGPSYQGSQEKVIFTSGNYDDMKKGVEYLAFIAKNQSGKYGIFNMNAGRYDIEKLNSYGSMSEITRNERNIAAEIIGKYGDQLKLKK